jgi:hypothetical protein
VSYTRAQITTMREALVIGEPVVRGGGIERDYRCRHCGEVLMSAVLAVPGGLAETPRQRRQGEYAIIEHLSQHRARSRFSGGCVRKPHELRSDGGRGVGRAARRPGTRRTG